MKYLGGISIDFVENETIGQTGIALGIKLKGVPSKAVAHGVLQLILELQGKNPDFFDKLEEVAKEVIGDEEEDEE